MSAEADGAKSEALPSARADFYSGLGWIVLGAAIGIASWRMDRLEHLGVSFFTAPGLVPGILGLMLAACGAILLLRAVRDGAFASAQRPPVLLEAATLRRVGVTLFLSLGFAVGLVGRGLPFPAAAALFLFAQVAVLQYPERKARGEVGRGLLVAALFACTASAAISTVFQEILLVRLP